MTGVLTHLIDYGFRSFVDEAMEMWWSMTDCWWQVSLFLVI
jgi:hypothetical protein